MAGVGKSGDGGLVGWVCCRVLHEWCVTTVRYTLTLTVTVTAVRLSHPHKQRVHNGKVETPLFVPGWHLDSGEGKGHDHTSCWAGPSCILRTSGTVQLYCIFILIISTRHTPASNNRQ